LAFDSKPIRQRSSTACPWPLGFSCLAAIQRLRISAAVKLHLRRGDETLGAMPFEHQTPRSALERSFAVLLVLLSVAALGAHIAYLNVPVVDDAGISISYALTFLEGHGLRLTPASQIVEAFSNPLWMALLGVSVPLRIEPLAFTKTLACACALLTIPAFAAWGPAAEERPLRVEDAAVGIASAVTAFAYWSASGMETALHSVLLGVSGALLLRELRRGQGAASGLALGLLALTRPEAPLYIAGAALVWMSTRHAQRKMPARQELKITLWIAVLAGGYELFRWIYFASVLPNTYYAKRFWDFGAAGYLRDFYQTHKALCIAAGVGFLGSTVGGSAVFRRGVLAALFVLSGLVFAWQSKGDWMREWRFIAPIVPCFGACIAAGLSGIRNRVALALAPRWPSRAALPLGALALIGIVFAAEARVAQSRSPDVKRGPELPVRYIGDVVERVRRELQPFGELHPVVGLPDLGGLGIYLRNAEVIDVGGLADYAIAHHANNYPAIEDYLLWEGPPTIIDAHGPSGHIRAFASLMALYQPPSSTELRQMSSFFVLRGLEAGEDPRCPGGKKLVLSLSVDELRRRIDEHLESDQPHPALMLWRCARAYHAEAQLPARVWRAQSAVKAERRALQLSAAGNLTAALRYMSFAAVVDSGNAHHRRRAEEYREKLFPRAP
jgi:hypothetical protein